MNTNVQDQFKFTEVYQIERIHNPTPEEFQRGFLSVRKPVIITGGMSGWKALSSWTPDYLSTTVGNRQVDVNVSQSRMFMGDTKTGFASLRKTMKFSDFMSVLLEKNRSTSNSYYLQGQPMTTIFPELVQEIETPDYFDKKLLLVINLWLGAHGNISPLHYDASHNLLAQVSGRKRILLFDPKQTSFLYPFPAYSKIPHLSQVNIDEPDFEKFPKFSKAKCIECVLEPGEMLFIPVLWWHQVYSFDTLNIAVNFWWKEKLRQLLLTYSGMRLLAQIPAFFWQEFRNKVNSTSNPK
ncbi:cupin-like domain-containing protein [Scytonema sp. UIC 10036]|uniref:cupin-like domain-containing protein n=1 Tax=Scytonema sp. UIC 10036 TaxID=2304196 RepID=UPI0012DAE4CB|nr:cupin-like domain-containing protein [Scytonema sp. UIC 10036]MUH01873.1 cupin-like domain-containing protein [Scytonema sp. UIC 10036]